MEARGGDYPLSKSNHIGVLVLLGDVSRSNRVAEIQSTTVEVEQNHRERVASDAADREDGAETVVNDHLDSLF